MEEARTAKLGDWSATSTAALTTSVSLQPGRREWVVVRMVSCKSGYESCASLSSFSLPLTLFSLLSPPLAPSFFLSLPLSLPSSQVSYPPLITCPPSAPTACGQPLPRTLHQHNQSHGNTMGPGGAGRHRRRASLYLLPQTTGCEWE